MWFFRFAALFSLTGIAFLWFVFAFFGQDANIGFLANAPMLLFLLWLSLRQVGRAISVTYDGFDVHNGILSHASIRFEHIESFAWRHNITSIGGGGERLWIALNDGQWCPTPVIKGGNGFGQPDIKMTEDQARTFVGTLESMRLQGRTRPR